MPLLYYYTNLNSSVIRCLFSGDIYLSFDILLLTSSFSECNSVERSSFGGFGCNSVETLVILFAILLPIKSPVASAVF